MKIKKLVIIPAGLVLACMLAANATESSKGTTAVEATVTFVELGSVNCIPCKAMQPVMKEIEEKYGNQIKVIFYDVWKQENKPYAVRYRVRAIPTQVFLDKNNKEFFRHEGFFPAKEIEKVLDKHLGK